MTTRRRSPQEVLEALEAAAEMDRIEALSPEELDGELRAAGFDPKEVARQGEALAADLLAMRDRETGAAEGLAAERARLVRIAARRGKLSRTELVARIEQAKADARLPAPVAMMFRNRAAGEEASDEELEAVLTQLEAHIERAEEEKKRRGG